MSANNLIEEATNQIGDLIKNSVDGRESELRRQIRKVTRERDELVKDNESLKMAVVRMQLILDNLKPITSKSVRFDNTAKYESDSEWSEYTRCDNCNCNRDALHVANW